jgi:hypothetical protein
MEFQMCNMRKMERLMETNRCDAIVTEWTLCGDLRGIFGGLEGFLMGISWSVGTNCSFAFLAERGRAEKPIREVLKVGSLVGWGS